MFLTIVGALLLLVAVIAAIVALGVKDARAGAIGTMVVAGLLGIFAIGSQLFYQLDTGEAGVLTTFGKVSGQEVTPGVHGKNPFASVTKFNVRNQQVSFVGTGKTDYTGGSAEGPEITVQDADGVTSNIDISLRYSIDPTKVSDLYRSYNNEQAFVQSYVVQTIRGTVRDVPNGFQTIDLITKRASVNAAIQTALTKAWAGSGVSVDNVSLQDIRPPAAVVSSYAAAQQAQIKVTTEQNNLKAAQVSAQQVVVQAKATAQANNELAKSLTAPVLKQHALDTMAKLAAKGNLVITDGSGSTLLNVTK